MDGFSLPEDTAVGTIVSCWTGFLFQTSLMMGYFYSNRFID
jgi:hypothetical protein